MRIKKYEKPVIKKVNLVADEAVLRACKTDTPTGGPGQSGQGACGQSARCQSAAS